MPRKKIAKVIRKTPAKKRKRTPKRSLSPSVATGRSLSNGRFTKGNKHSPSSSAIVRMMELREKVLNYITDEDIYSVIDELKRQADKGVPAMMKEFLNRTLGKEGRVPYRVGVDFPATGETKEDSIAFYTAMRNSPATTGKEKMEAQTRIDLIKGHIELKHGQSGTTDEQAEAINALLTEIEVSGAPPEADEDEDTSPSSEKPAARKKVRVKVRKKVKK